MRLRPAGLFVGAVEREVGRAASRATVERAEDVVAQVGGQAPEARQLGAGDGQEPAVFLADDLVRARDVGRARIVFPRERADAGVGVGDVAGGDPRVGNRLPDLGQQVVDLGTGRLKAVEVAVEIGVGGADQ